MTKKHERRSNGMKRYTETKISNYLDKQGKKIMNVNILKFNMGGLCW